MGRREARIPSGAKKSTEPPRWGRGGLECPAVSIHNTSEGPRERGNANSQEEATPRHPDPKTAQSEGKKTRTKTQGRRSSSVRGEGGRHGATKGRRDEGWGRGEPFYAAAARTNCIIHRWPHPWHARGGKGGSDFPVRGNRRRGRGRLPARGSSGSPRRRRCGPWPPRRAVSRSSRSRTSGARSGIAAEHRLELVLLADATRCAETSVSSNRVSMDAFAKAPGNIAVILRRVGAV